jgi:hypothetical protein
VLVRALHPSGKLEVVTAGAIPSSVVAAFAAPKGAIPLTTKFRSTWLASSLRALRSRNLLDAYFAALPPHHHDAVRSAVAGVWLSCDVAVAHYEACDSLQLATAEQLAIGAEVTHFAQKTVFSMTLRAAREAGVTPWSCFALQPRLWRTVWVGGDVGVFRLGPKEARVEVVGWPCSRISYCRIAMRGMLTAQTELFCKKAYVAELPALCTPTALGYRVAWV